MGGPSEAWLEGMQCLADTLPGMLALKNTNDEIVIANARFAAMLGKRPLQLRNAKATELFGEQAQLCQAVDREIVATGQPKLGTAQQWTTPDGQQTWLRTDRYPCIGPDGEVEGIFVYISDTTETSLNEQRLRFVLENSTDILLVFSREGRYLDVLGGADRLVASPDDLVGKTVFEVLTPELATMVQTTAAKALDEGPQEITYDITIRGRRTWFSARVVPYETAAEPAVVWAARDVTKAKEAEDERLALEARIQNTQKLESLGVLAGGIAHDFNNLLVGVLANATVTLEDVPASSPYRPALEAIGEAAERAADLCRQLLAYTGQGQMSTDTVDVNALIEGTSQLLKASITNAAELEYSLAKELPPISADSTQVRQVLMNLMINASEAVGDGSGKIRVRTGATPLTAQDLARSRIEGARGAGEYVYVEVSDSGCGMDEATLSRMFDPFFTTKFTGRGLGLSAALGIVRAHAGAVFVDTEPGRFTTVRIAFPAAEARSRARVTRPTEQIDEGRGAVLVVDDDALVLDSARRVLSRAGYDVEIAHDGVEALELIAEGANRFSCVILDLTMPKMKGEVAYERLQTIAPGLPVVVSSGFHEDHVLGKFQGHNVSFLQKPYRASDLSQAVAAACDAVPPA